MDPFNLYSTIQSEDESYIGYLMDQMLTFNQHAVQLLSGLVDYAESNYKFFKEKKETVYIDHVTKNDAISAFSTKTKRKMSSKMKSRATSRQSRIAFRKMIKAQASKDCLKYHLEQMTHYFTQIYTRLEKDIIFFDFENYFPLCKEAMRFFVNYAKIFYLKKYMYAPGPEFFNFKENSKSFLRMITPFIEKVIPIVTEYLSYDDKNDEQNTDKRFDWNSIDIRSDYSPYRKNSSSYKFETNILINFREVIDWIIIILSLINIKKTVKEEAKKVKQSNLAERFQIPEKFRPLIELFKDRKSVV